MGRADTNGNGREFSARGTPKPATMAIGYARQETIGAIRRESGQPSQGLETVRKALNPAAGRRRITRA